MASHERMAHVASLLTIALLAVVLAGCGGGDSPGPKPNPRPGDKVTVTVTKDGATAYQAVHEYVSLPDAETETHPAEAPCVVALLKSETYHDESFKNVLAPIDPVTHEELVGFLANHWDAYIGGVEDKGQNIEEFLQFLREHKYSLERFLGAFQTSGRTLSAFMADYTRKEVQTRDAASTGLDVAKFAWDVIKDNKPQSTTDGAFTSILNSADKNWGNYMYAVKDTSSVYRFIITEDLLLTSYTAVDIEFQVVCMYGATHATLPGHYLPSVYVNFSKVDVEWGHSAEGSASVSNVSNIAGTDVNPQIDFLVDTKDSTVIQSWDRRFTFTITGKDGL